MSITEYLKKNKIYLDGGMGTLLQAAGLPAGTLPERWNKEKPEIIEEIHLSYLNAGSNVICANTFGANVLKYDEVELEEIISAALAIAKSAISKCELSTEKWVALDVGPTGRMLAPYGDLDFEDAVRIFAKTIRLGEKHGADLIFIETMTDSYETKAALLAAKENSSLPVFVSNAYGEDGKLLTGASPAAMVAMLEGMGADAIGINCSLGPRALRGVAEEYLKYSSTPIIFKPNAGLPKSDGEKTFYDVCETEFAVEVAEFMKMGIGIVGGCCGTTPKYIAELVSATHDIAVPALTEKNISCISSYTHAVSFGSAPVLIGERINPTGKKRFKDALKSRDIAYILGEGVSQEERGVHVLDVNVGLPEIDEVEMLTTVVRELQAVTALPLQIDTSDTRAMEAAIRLYNGKAMINSVNGKSESMEAVFPIAKKYGGLIVALTLDESGIPSTAAGRLEIAKRILAEAEKYGISKKDIIFDPLAMAVSADSCAAKETLLAVELITRELGCHTILGISNVSFGLPAREVITSVYFSMALARGLSAAIMNPHSAEMMKAFYSYLALIGLDSSFASYIGFAESLQTTETLSQKSEKNSESGNSELQRAIIKGMRSEAARITNTLLSSMPALDIISNEIIPALDTVGVGFEKKTVYLPGLLMSAEAASAAFEEIKAAMPSRSQSAKCAFVIATVKGDIHDIGKNIVKLLLENYGFAVSDLGRDVSPQVICDEVIRLHAPLLGLSALMTTTTPAMEETIKLVKAHAPWCKTVVGGAVLTKEFAETIGADAYAKDAMSTVRYAEKISKSIT